MLKYFHIPGQVTERGKGKNKKAKDSTERKGNEQERGRVKEKRMRDSGKVERKSQVEKGKTNKLTSESLVYCWVGTR